MSKIKKVIYKPERRIVTIHEYQSILSMYPFRKSIVGSNLICTECGDEITYCHGDVNEPYFKHNPSRFGGKHVNCSLFTQGIGISISESTIRKKFVEDTDVTLNFEMKMIGGKWSSYITIPPFFTKEIDNYSSKNTVLTISTTKKKIGEIPLDKDHFAKGEIKQVSLDGFPPQIFLNVKSSESSQGLYYKIDGFSADTQIYKTLITQEYTTQASSDINMSNKKFFNCKRVSGKVYTGRHYILFVRDHLYLYNSAFSSLGDDDVSIKQVILPKDDTFGYRIYDVVFKHVNQQTKQFCESRECTLVQESDAVIIWPPVNFIGDYKFFKNNSTELFIVFENKSNALDMYTSKIRGLSGLKVRNENIEPFYLTVSDFTKEEKQPYVFNESEQLDVSFLNDSTNYLFTDGVLYKRIDEKKYSLKKNEYLLSITNRLEMDKFVYPNIQKTANSNKLLTLIRYSEKLVSFNKVEYEYLASKYRDDDLVTSYLNSCLEYKRIKENAKNYLMEEKL